MRNVKSRCALALSAADAKKNQTILSSTVFTLAKHMLNICASRAVNM